eukprot:6484624-Amphidinium_carterae.1
MGLSQATEQAAELKHLVPALAAIIDEYLDLGTEYGRLVRQLLVQAKAIDGVLDGNKIYPVLPPDALSAFRTHVANLNRILVELRMRSAEHALWNWTIKNHILYHISDQAALLNPTWSWNYSQESFLGQVRELVQSCRTRATAFSVQHAVLEKWVYALEIFWTRSL